MDKILSDIKSFWNELETILINILEIFELEGYYFNAKEWILSVIPILLELLLLISLSLLIILILMILIAAPIGYIIDRKKIYNPQKLTKKFKLIYPSNSMGGAEVVAKYWLWQRRKKEIIQDLYINYTIHGNSETRHARTLEKRKLIPIPFLREIYGLSKSN